MGFHNLLAKCDRALVAYLVSAGAGTEADIVPSKRADDLPEPPFTGCASGSATELRPYSGVYTVKASVEIHTNAAPDVVEDAAQLPLDSDARVQATFDALHDQYSGCGDKLADMITTAAGISGFTVDNVRISAIEQGRGEKDGEWIDTINLELICRTS